MVHLWSVPNAIRQCIQKFLETVLAQIAAAFVILIAVGGVISAAMERTITAMMRSIHAQNVDNILEHTLRAKGYISR